MSRISSTIVATFIEQVISPRFILCSDIRKYLGYAFASALQRLNNLRCDLNAEIYQQEKIEENISALKNLKQCPLD
ncbi:hypothetical protein OnM2_047063 [Erysiphe neolycopersici]|uniref:Uncharacterized protein n=1 Tax=Erysiphe neolycopersici TaxID=212602 RepID=A0A420HTL3_9PEZI|nr:hypothetical protein OnM2_047063 [Erysiphe neolycopersici]